MPGGDIMRITFRSYAPKLLLAGLTVLIALLVIDFMAYVVFDIKIPGHKPERFFQFSPLLGWDQIPHSSGYWYRYDDGTKFYVEINSHGFADSERLFSKTRPRIALIGDSLTQNWEAELSDRGQYVLADLLEQRLEVLNFGMRGYGTDQTLILFEDQVVQFEPDIVIYTFCVNDFWNNVDTSAKPYFELEPSDPNGLELKGYPIEFQSLSTLGVNTGLHNYSLVLRKFEELVPRVKNKFHALLGRPSEATSVHTPLESHFELRPYKRHFDAEDRRRTEISLKLVAALDKVVKNQGMKFLVVEGLYRPAQDESCRQRLTGIYGDIFEFDRVTQSLLDFTQEHGIAFLSLPRLLQGSDLQVSALMFKRDNMHFNREGIQFYCRAVADKLRSLQWLDESPLPDP